MGILGVLVLRHHHHLYGHYAVGVSRF